MKKKLNGKYIKKFKAHAVKLVAEDGMSIRSAAKQLSMPKSTLSGWLKKQEEAPPVKSVAQESYSSGEEAELEKIRRELAEVKAERDELKRSVEPEVFVVAEQAVVVGQEENFYEVGPHDPTLLDRAREQWKIGDWDSLTKIGETDLEHHPERAKLALLAAAGYQQKNDLVATRWWLRLAQEWGCDKKLVAKVLIAGVHNRLGCAAVVAGQQDRALQHFQSSIAIGSPCNEMRLISQVRMEQQLNHSHVAQGSVRNIQASLNVPVPTSNADASHWEQEKKLVFNAETYSYYHDLSKACSEKRVVPFIFLDCKSLPRSGLHYMKNVFAKVLQEHFSFCEWYQETGCCKKMPCALTSYAEQCKKSKTSRLRMTKSHDFELNDPEFSPMYSLRRIILVRNPLFLLTSWFVLEQLSHYKRELQQVGITVEKIWLSHEAEVLMTAYQVMDEAFVAPGSDELLSWLDDKTQYVLGFLDKWVRPALTSSQPFLQVVRYEEINSFIAATLRELRDDVPDGEKERIGGFLDEGISSFEARQDPFHAPSEKLSGYLAGNASVFKHAADKILTLAPTGTFSDTGTG